VENEIVLERVVNSDGRSTCRIEGRGVSQQMMRKVGSALITVHGQHESLRLSDENECFALIDTFSKTEDALSSYRESFASWKEIKNQISAFIKDESGLSTVEIILILVVLIALVLIFKDEMIDIVESIFKTINKNIKKI
jgi:DNA repair protein RecN (Recombination protein N)